MVKFETVKQVIIAFLVAFLCVQTSATAATTPASHLVLLTKKQDHKVCKKLQVVKALTQSKDAKHPVSPKKKRTKGFHEDFIICHFSRILLFTRQLLAIPLCFIPNTSLSVLFFPNGKRGPPTLA